jgi:hypothetical protein
MDIPFVKPLHGDNDFDPETTGAGVSKVGILPMRRKAE